MGLEKEQRGDFAEARDDEVDLKLSEWLDAESGDQ